MPNSKATMTTTEWRVIDVKVGPKRVSRMRTKDRKCLEFAVTWSTRERTMEPIWNLVDCQAEEVTEPVTPLLAQYLNHALFYPRTHRLCWFCPKKCEDRRVLCDDHEHIGDWLFPLLTPEGKCFRVPPPVVRQLAYKSEDPVLELNVPYRPCPDVQVPMLERWAQDF